VVEATEITPSQLAGAYKEEFLLSLPDATTIVIPLETAD
jgi:hypothetical protein